MSANGKVTMVTKILPFACILLANLLFTTSAMSKTLCAYSTKIGNSFLCTIEGGFFDIGTVAFTCRDGGFYTSVHANMLHYGDKVEVRYVFDKENIYNTWATKTPGEKLVLVSLPDSKIIFDMFSESNELEVTLKTDMGGDIQQVIDISNQTDIDLFKTSCKKYLSD